MNLDNEDSDDGFPEDGFDGEDEIQSDDEELTEAEFNALSHHPEGAQSDEESIIDEAEWLNDISEDLFQESPFDNVNLYASFGSSLYELSDRECL